MRIMRHAGLWPAAPPAAGLFPNRMAVITAWPIGESSPREVCLGSNPEEITVSISRPSCPQERTSGQLSRIASRDFVYHPNPKSRLLAWKLTLVQARRMSAKGHGPTHAPQQSTPTFDHIVGKGQRDGE